MNPTRRSLSPIVLPVQVSLALPPAMRREDIDRLSPSDYAIYLATVRARQRLLQRGRRNNAVHGPRPSGGYQTTTLP